MKLATSNAGKTNTDRSQNVAQPTMLDILRSYRDFRMLSAGTVGSQAGQWILNIALAWLMLELTDSALYVGLLGFAAGIPMVLVAVPAGVLLDRYDRRTVLIACQVGMVAVGTALLAAITSGVATAELLLAAMFCYGGLMSLNNAARQTIVPATVPRIALPAAFGLTSAATHASRVVGPSVAGLLIGVSGVSVAVVFQLAVVTGSLIASLMLSSDIEGARRQTSTGGLLDGFSYVRNHRVVLHLTLLAAIPMFFIFPYLQLLPVIARDVLKIGPDGLGLLLAVSGVGAVTGGLLTERAARIGPLGLFVLLATIAYGGIALIVAFSTSTWLTAGAIFSASLTGSAFQSLNNTLFQLQLDDDVRGRVTGVYMLGFGAFALGGLPMGYLADLQGTAFAISSGAMASSAFALLLLFMSPDLRALRKPANH